MRLTLKDGTAIYWGFRYQEATVQSVAIFDARGRPRLLAAVNEVPWLHARLLGFNVDCKEPGMTEACRFVTQTEWLQIVPTRIYLLPSMRLLEPPKVKAADIPLEAFTQ